MTLSVYDTMERWPLKEPFSIARYTFVESLVVTIRVRDSEGYEGVGECEPHEWDEQASLGMLKSAGLEPDKWLEPQWATRRIDRERLIQELPRSPIRNAIDCALWDLACKREGKRASHFADTEWSPLTVIPTIGIDTPEKMETIARSFGPVSMIKVKLGASDGLDADRMEAVSHAMPGVPLLIDVNTGWSPEMLTSMLPVARRCNVRIIEQPMLPEMDEHMLAPVNDMLYCADESCLDRASLPRIQPYFQYINIKLDKTGGAYRSLGASERS